jgi:parvulin-like peptidyl-prolyl isomerase
MANSFFRRSVGDFPSRFLLLPALILASVALLAGCHPAVTDPKDPKFVVAEKGTWKISRAELDTEVNSFLKQHQATVEQVGPSKMPIVETMMLKNMVLKKLILEQAATLDLKDVDKEDAAQLDAVKQTVPPGQDFATQLKAAGMTEDDLKAKIHEQVLVHKVLETEAFKNIDPTEQQIDAIYMQNKDSFNIPAKVRVSRVLILVDDKTSAADKAAKKKAIGKAHDRVVKGEDFSKVAMEVSEDRYSAPKGGDIGPFQRGENEPGFDEVAFTTKQNAVSPVFQTSLGYQFLKVTSIQPAGVVPVAEARNYIASKLKDQNMQIQSQVYAKKLLADSGVTYHLVLVDPPAQPTAPPGAGPDASNGGAPPQGAQGAPDASQQPGPADASQQAPPAETPSAPPSAPAPTSSTPNQ